MPNLLGGGNLPPSPKNYDLDCDPVDSLTAVRGSTVPKIAGSDRSHTLRASSKRRGPKYRNPSACQGKQMPRQAEIAVARARVAESVLIVSCTWFRSRLEE